MSGPYFESWDAWTLGKFAREVNEQRKQDEKLMKQALNALDAYSWQQVQDATTALRERLTQPQRTHWEGCEEVHPECKKPGCAECGKSGGWALYCVACMEKLAQPEQKPVAWMDEFGNVFPLGAQRGPKHLNEPMKPLYTTPQRREWVGLTDEEKLHLEIMGGKSDVMLAEAIEAKLKEKNA